MIAALDTIDNLQQPAWSLLMSKDATPFRGLRPVWSEYGLFYHFHGYTTQCHALTRVASQDDCQF